MPRPHPPRKRPRRRPPSSQRAARADAALTKQTADSATPKTPAPKASAAAKQTVPDDPRTAPDAMWARRSYAIFMACIFAVQVVIGVLLFFLAAPPKNGYELIGVALGGQPYHPIPLLAACLVASRAAQRLSGEVRSLRIMEALAAGLVIYALFVILAITAGFLLTSVSPTASNGCTNPTPLPLNATATQSSGSTPCPSPSASPSPSPSGASASASPRGSGGAIAASSLTARDAATLGVIDIAAYVLALFIYPPVYKRFRIKPPPPRDQAGSRGRQR